MIYFLQAVDGGPVKIGTTVRLSERLKTLSKQHGLDLVVLAVTDGSFEVENRLHRRFSHLRVAREWFRLDAELLDFIAAECRAWDGSDEALPSSYVTAKFDAEAIRVAKIVAAYRDIDLAEYLSEIVMDRASRDLQAEQAKEQAPRKGKGAK